jgi:hypothetical protein
MKMLNRLFIVLILISLGMNVRAQELVSSAGGMYSDAQLNVSWTIGESVIETFTGENYVLTQGFQQPGLALVGIENLDEQFADVKVYPNPTSDYVRLDLNVDIKNLSYRLLNASGKVIDTEIIQNPSTKISFSEVEAGIYLVQLMDGSKSVKIFRIVKN